MHNCNNSCITKYAKEIVCICLCACVCLCVRERESKTQAKVLNSWNLKKVLICFMIFEYLWVNFQQYALAHVYGCLQMVTSCSS